VLLGTSDALALRGKAAIANAKLAYAAFRDTFTGPRWEALVARGANVQRPLWASTGTKNDAYPDTLYVDELIGPDSVNTIPDATLESFLDHGSVARTVDVAQHEAASVRAQLLALGVDLDAIAVKLEADGVAAFQDSFDSLIASLAKRAERLAPRAN